MYLEERGEFVETNVISDIKIGNWDDYFQVFGDIISLAEISDSISSVFGFDQSGVAKNTEYGRDKFISPEILRKILANRCAENLLDYAMRSLITPHGVSFNYMKKRYEKYRRFQLQKPSRFANVETYARYLGMDPIEDKAYF